MRSAVNTKWFIVISLIALVGSSLATIVAIQLHPSDNNADLLVTSQSDFSACQSGFVCVQADPTNLTNGIRNMVGSDAVQSQWLSSCPSAVSHPDLPRLHPSLLRELYGRIQEVGAVSMENGIISRPYLSRADDRTALLLVDYMVDAGMDVRIDPVGNVVGRYECTESCWMSSSQHPKTLVLGSHFDSVRNGGKFDGIYGVLVAITAVKSLVCSQVKLPFSVMVIAFDDEEGNNPFQTTNVGAKAWVNRLGNVSQFLIDHPALVEALSKRFQSAGLPDSLEDISQAIKESAETEIKSILGYIELHIEQGPILEKLNRPAASVQTIYGQSRLIANIQGESGHAGTVPMNMRKDALVLAAKLITFLEEMVLKHPNYVGTVGVLKVGTASTNTIPGHVEMSFDIRGPEDSVRESLVEKLIEHARQLAKSRGLELDIHITHFASASLMDSRLRTLFDQVLQKDGYEPLELHSGAGHDGMIFADIIETGMLFLRCEKGISHSPDENMTVDDINYGASVLQESILKIAKSWEK